VNARTWSYIFTCWDGAADSRKLSTKFAIRARTPANDVGISSKRVASSFAATALIWDFFLFLEAAVKELSIHQLKAQQGRPVDLYGSVGGRDRINSTSDGEGDSCRDSALSV
jgi:hypothetical protein